VFLNGVGTVMSAPRDTKPELMQFIISRLTGVSGPPWSDAERAGWAAQIEAARAPYAAALGAAHTAGLANHLAQAAFVGVAKGSLRALVAFKRDLKYLGLSEAQIHAIIPDATPHPASNGNGAPIASGPDPGVVTSTGSGAVTAAPPAGALPAGSSDPGAATGGGTPPAVS
jgi:hypothetical protein